MNLLFARPISSSYVSAASRQSYELSLYFYRDRRCSETAGVPILSSSGFESRSCGTRHREMCEPSVRSWLRNLRFAPECYDQSVFYVDHNGQSPGERRPESPGRTGGASLQGYADAFKESGLAKIPRKPDDDITASVHGNVKNPSLKCSNDILHSLTTAKKNSYQCSNKAAPVKVRLRSFTSSELNTTSESGNNCKSHSLSINRHERSVNVNYCVSEDNKNSSHVVHRNDASNPPTLRDSDSGDTHLKFASGGYTTYGDSLIFDTDSNFSDTVSCANNKSDYTKDACEDNLVRYKQVIPRNTVNMDDVILNRTSVKDGYGKEEPIYENLNSIYCACKDNTSYYSAKSSEIKLSSSVTIINNDEIKQEERLNDNETTDPRMSLTVNSCDIFSYAKGQDVPRDFVNIDKNIPILDKMSVYDDNEPIYENVNIISPVFESNAYDQIHEIKQPMNHTISNYKKEGKESATLSNDIMQEPIYINMSTIAVNGNNRKLTSKRYNQINNKDSKTEELDGRNNLEDDLIHLLRRKSDDYPDRKHSKSVRRKRYAILENEFLKPVLLPSSETFKNSCSDSQENTVSNPLVFVEESEDSSDSVSWKSSSSSVLYDGLSDNTMTARCEIEASPSMDLLIKKHREDFDGSSDSISWKSSRSSFSNYRSTTDISSNEDNRSSISLHSLTDTKSLEDTRKRNAILDEFRRHALLEPIDDPVYMNQRPILESSCFVYESFVETKRELTSEESENGVGTRVDAYLNSSRESEAAGACKSETNSLPSDENVQEFVAERWPLKYATVRCEPVEFEEVAEEFSISSVTYARIDFGDVWQWQRELIFDYSSEDNDDQEYTSLEDINGKKECISPFPVEAADVEIRQKSEADKTASHRSQTIHFGQGYVTENKDLRKDRPLNMNGVSKIYYEGTCKKVSRNQILRILHGRMMLLNDKGETEILKEDVHITRYKPLNRKEIQIANTTAEECKLYKLQFDNSKDANTVLGELHKYFNRNLQERPRSNSLTEKPPPSPQNEERVQIRHRLLKLLGRRSSKDMLEKKGIIKNEPIFGNTLNNLYLKYKLPVPMFIVRIIEIIEMPKNIRSLGLYRASGNLATIQKIRFQIDRNNLRILEDFKSDIDVLTGTLKLFFRELSEPVIPYKTYEELLRFVDKNLDSKLIEKVKYSIGKMELPHRETFLTLLEHLVHVEQFKSENKMDAYNISIVWGPTLIWPPESCQENILQNHTNANKIIEMLLNVYRKDFLKQWSKDESSPRSSLSNYNRINVIPEGNTEGNTTNKNINKSPKKLELLDSSLSKFNAKTKFGSMENLFKSIKKDLPSSPKDTKWNLENLCRHSKEKVPEFLTKTIPVIEKSIKTEHIYCKQLSLEQSEKIKIKLSRHKYGSLEKSDPYELASSVKLFISELDPPLIPMDNFLKMAEAIEKEDEIEKARSIKQEISKLNQCHKNTLNYLFKHFVRLCRQQELNGMTSHNMALSWMPVLCKRLLETSDVQVEKCVKVVDFLIQLHDERLVVTLDSAKNYQRREETHTMDKADNNNLSKDSISYSGGPIKLKPTGQENINNNVFLSHGPVKKRVLKNSSSLYRVSKYIVHPPSIYDNVPSTQIHSSKEDIRGEAKLLETDSNKNVKKHERTTKL